MPYIPPHIQKLKPYQSARDLYQGDYLFLDANENCFGPLVGPEDIVGDVTLSDYPDTDSTRLREAMANYYDLDPDETAIFNGSDEAIPDILLAFSSPGDKVAGLDIGFGMYRSFCQIHDREYIEIPTNKDFKIEKKEELSQQLKSSRVCFLDVPNNPSGQIQSVEDIEWMIEQMPEGLFVLDLAYFGFLDSEEIKNFIKRVSKYENLLIMYSFSKTWSLAGARIGAVFGNKNLINALIKVRIPYHVNSVAEALAVKALEKHEEMQRRCDLIKEYRADLMRKLSMIKLSDSGQLGESILQVYPSQANFILVRFPENSQEIFGRLVEEHRIILRYFGAGDTLAGKDNKLAHCVRITVGTPEQNEELLEALKKILSS
mgnify:FL=1